ncbi:MAG: antibiotic biosynthesis monooxygenase [Bacteroidetes bacterium]|nr:MAG: antibiotic biosynthesis monooxygenase [Bacteroidota bacterium]
MITRIVRMEFREDALEEFHRIFEQHHQRIRNFPGCLQVELLRDTRHPAVRYTISQWETEAALEQYRQSELFGKVWPRTKALFAAKAQAFSMEKIES